MKSLLAIWIGKSLQNLIKIAQLGGGSAAPGLLGLRVEPNLIQNLSRGIHQNVLVTGTNGKTTTTALLSHFAKASNLKVIHNSTGSNMQRGIASKLIEQADIWGKVHADLAVWEVDEANLKNMIKSLKPQIIVILNAARDQLDRYGELNSLVGEWKDALTNISYPTLILINGDDANTYNLSTQIKNSKLLFQTFGSKQKIVDWEENNPKKVKLTYVADGVAEIGLKAIKFNINSRNHKYRVSFPVAGPYNVYNFLAAFSAGANLGIPHELMIKASESYNRAFGRIEQIRIRNKESFICLIKNPNGASSMLKTIAKHIKSADTLMFVLNDNTADGTDVSWIWDAEFKKVHAISPRFSSKSRIICGGKRAEDMALRLKYAGVSGQALMIEPNLKAALNQAVKNPKGRAFILPTYTALLQIQKVLADWGYKKRYWEEV